MAEKYSGTRFETVFEKKSVPETDEKAGSLVKWCRIFAEMRLSQKIGKGYSGNLSYRTKKGFIITGTAVSFEKLTKKDLVEVVSCDEKTRQVRVTGIIEPSSEAFMHSMVYNARPEVNAVFHLHDKKVVENAEKMGLPITKDLPYGSIERAKNAAKTLEGTNYIVINGEGMLATGATIEEAALLTLEKYKNAQKIRK